MKKNKDSVDESELDRMLIAEGFDDDLKIKLTALFESSVSGAVTEKQEELEAIAEQYVTEAIAEKTEELEDKLDKYLSYIAEEFLKENEIAIEGAQKIEAAEAILEGITSLVTEQKLTIPEESVDAVADLEETVAGMTADLDESIESAIAMKAEISSLKREITLGVVSEGLTTVQADKLSSLTESFDFDVDNEQDFITKATVIKESLTKTSVEDDKDSLNEGEGEGENDDNGASIPDYMAAIVANLNKGI